jgi:hypothetical protein
MKPGFPDLTRSYQKLNKELNIRKLQSKTEDENTGPEILIERYSTFGMTHQLTAPPLFTL